MITITCVMSWKIDFRAHSLSRVQGDIGLGYRQNASGAFTGIPKAFGQLFRFQQHSASTSLSGH